ncbi:MAG TPA: hypothetical protein VHS56_02170 [Candidatus Cybelea sp.]|jgi:hypothetical protein|nr:hypothetical protein [Candidatus Cybelea sp.]
MKFACIFGLSTVALTLSGCLGAGSTTGSGALPAAGSLRSEPPSRIDGALLYVTGGRNTQILTYPSAKRVETFGNGGDLCSDKSGNVYVTRFKGVQVYAHGATTPFRTLKMAYDFPVDCSVDPTSGDLAVAVACLSCSTSVVIYRHAKGTPKAYSAGMLGQHCGYDNRGNLFVSGNSSGAEFVELPKGGAAFTPISSNPPIPTDGHIQWDGHFLTVLNPGSHGVTPEIDQVTVSGSTGTIVGSTPLNGTYNASSAWIEGDRVVVPFVDAYYGASRIGYWKYPEGGDPEKVLLDRHYRFHGANTVAVSEAPDRR